MNEQSLDPRINRLQLGEAGPLTIAEGENWNTYEVFHQEKRGKQAEHVGIVHASGPEMALMMAKEVFGRRGKTANLWVTKTSDVYTFHSEDEDIFSTAPEKLFREPATYKVRDRIEKFQKENNITTK